MEHHQIDRNIRNVIESVLIASEPLRAMGLAEVPDHSQRQALRVMLNCIDVLSGVAIPEIEETIVNTSYKLGEMHLIHNFRLTSQQRANFEQWVFELNN